MRLLCITLQEKTNSLSRLGLGLLGSVSALPEAVLESSVDILEVRHSAGTAVA
jgi:hypothetical protein